VAETNVAAAPAEKGERWAWRSWVPWALVVIEALAAGCPVISSDVVGAAWELIEDGVNGRIFPSGDLGSLSYDESVFRMP